jgi:hypothetical protein
MASGRFSKQAAPYVGYRWLNANNAIDYAQGGSVTASPGPISQYEQNLPGDRIILSPMDALALSNNTVGNLYTGTYRYVGMRNNSTSVPQRGRAAFWDLTAISANAYNANTTASGNFIGSPQTDALYSTTSDEAANIGVVLMAGVYINTPPMNANTPDYWFIQESGKASVWFRGNNGNTLFGGANLTGTPAIGCGVYLAAAGNNNNANTGLFDVLTGTTFLAAVTGNVGANNAVTGNAAVAYATLDTMFTRFIGVAETLPSNGNLSFVDINLTKASYRW